MRATSILCATLCMLHAGCGGGTGRSKIDADRLTKKRYAARLARCQPQLVAAHQTEIVRWMKEKAETKQLADSVDSMLTDKNTGPLFAAISSTLFKAYLGLIDRYPSEEAFQKAVTATDGPSKEAPKCFATKTCDPFASCVAKAVTLSLLSVGDHDKGLLKLVSKPSLHDQMMATSSLPAAIALARPAMTDEHGKLSKGAALLAFWALQRGLKLGDLKSLQESDYKAVMKDSDEERGRHLCTTGPLIEIRAEKTPFGKLFDGGMWMGWGYSKVARFVAVGSTRGINQGSSARFCGVVIGRFSYPNSAGGTTHAVQLVGVFDLEENR